MESPGKGLQQKKITFADLVYGAMMSVMSGPLTWPSHRPGTGSPVFVYLDSKPSVLNPRLG